MIETDRLGLDTSKGMIKGTFIDTSFDLCFCDPVGCWC